jgi:hypothetical protein
MLDAAWYAVAVRNNFERIVAQSLRQKDYEILYLFTAPVPYFCRILFLSGFHDADTLLVSPM